MPYVDTPLPASLDLKPIAPPKRGRPFGPENPASGRPKGSVNRVVRDLKEGIIEAAENIGSDGNGEGGLVGFLEDLGRHHKRAFASLLVKLLPMQVSGNSTSAPPVAINIIGVPSGHYLSEEDIAKTRGEPLQMIEHTPPLEPLSSEEAQLLTKLNGLSREELMRLAGVSDVDHERSDRVDSRS